MKRILLLQHATSLHAETVDFACYIAKILGSPVTGVFLDDWGQSMSLRRVPDDVLRGGAIPGEWAQPKPAGMEPAVKRFEDACIYRESKYAVHSKIYVSKEDLVKESRFADLLLFRPDLSETADTSSFPSALTRFVLAHAACPVILVPQSFHTLDEVVFTYDGSKASVFAIKQFTYLFSTAIAWKKVKLLLVNDFVQVPSMREWMDVHYPDAEIVFLEGGTTEQLIRNLLPRDNSMVVMGAYSRATFSRLMKKSNADPLIDILLNPIFIAHGLQ